MNPCSQFSVRARSGKTLKNNNKDKQLWLSKDQNSTRHLVEKHTHTSINMYMFGYQASANTLQSALKYSSSCTRILFVLLQNSFQNPVLTYDIRGLLFVHNFLCFWGVSFIPITLTLLSHKLYMQYRQDTFLFEVARKSCPMALEVYLQYKQEVND